MAKFTIHTLESANPDARAPLEAAQKKFGAVPNLIGGLAEAPIAAEAYVTLTGLIEKSSFSPAERHVVWFAINAYHDCQYCMAAHTTLANMQRIDPTVVNAARDVAPQEDARLESLRQFALLVTERRGHVSDSEVDEFLDAGFTRQHVLEIVTMIAHKVISNYSNHIMHTPVDQAFQANAWERPAAQSA